MRTICTKLGRHRGVRVEKTHVVSVRKNCTVHPRRRLSSYQSDGRRYLRRRLDLSPPPIFQLPARACSTQLPAHQSTARRRNTTSTPRRLRVVVANPVLSLLYIYKFPRGKLINFISFVLNFSGLPPSPPFLVPDLWCARFAFTRTFFPSESFLSTPSRAKPARQSSTTTTTPRLLSRPRASGLCHPSVRYADEFSWVSTNNYRYYKNSAKTTRGRV